jgi:hypothetical protein
LEAIDNLGALIDTLMARLGHAARALVWVMVALICAMVAGALGVTALLVSLWDTQHLMTLVAPAAGFAALALLFGVVTARTLRAAPADAGSVVPRTLPPRGSQRRHHPLAWIVALVSLLFLGGSRELLALALRFRAVLALLAHALHVLQLFSRRRAAPPP